MNGLKVETSDYETILARAAWLGGLGRAPLVSFRSLFLALLGGGTPSLNRFRDNALELRRTLIAEVIAEWSRDGKDTFPPEIEVAHVRHPEHDTAPEDVTPSARAILELADKLSSNAPDTRHLMVATLLSHPQEFKTWQLRARSMLARVLAQQDAPEDGWRKSVRDHMSWPRSKRLESVLLVAQGLAGNKEVSADDVLRALIALGKDPRSVSTSYRWLVEQLDARALDGMKIPASSRPSSTTTPRLSAEVEAWLDVAFRYALTSASERVSTRHLMAALFGELGPQTAKRMLRQANGESVELARGWLVEMKRVKPNDDAATWEWLIENDVPRAEALRPDYANDVADGVDRMKIMRDVRALASVLAAKETTPPLSVGLFGEWGSGKSFFMKKMQEHIAQLADQSDKDKSSHFYSRIEQIEFNAWHYMDNDLWASLVAHLLDRLETRFRGIEAVEERENVETSLAYVDLQRSQLREKEMQAAEEVRRLDDEIAKDVPAEAMTIGVLASVGKEVLAYIEHRDDVKELVARAARELGRPADSFTLATMEKEYQKLLSWPRRMIRGLAEWWRETVASPQRAALVLACALVPIAAGLIASQVDQWVPKVIAAATALASLVGVVQRAFAHAKPIFIATKQAYDKAATLAEHIENNAKEALTTERVERESQRKQYAEQRTKLDQEAARLRAKLEPPQLSSLRQFVLERSQSTDYRDRQGIIALVNRDFRGLSERLKATYRSADDPVPLDLDRIVLYIDDLDRCTPERVVEVLQAIHLMMSFDLFIVVVAVDSSWLLQSLRAYYAKQFPDPEKGDGHERPQFYLEKIFQLPYTLPPMTEGKYESLVEGLLGASVESESSSTRPNGENTRAPAAGSTHSGRVAVERPSALREKLDLQPRNLSLTQRELTFLKGLGALLPSPRATKRLVNLYRIVRAGKQGDALAWFIDDHFQLIQILLAAVVGSAEETATWFEKVLVGTIHDRASLLRELDKPDRRFQLLGKLLADCRDVANWQRFVDACKVAARYSFETGRLFTKLRNAVPPVKAIPKRASSGDASSPAV